MKIIFAAALTAALLTTAGAEAASKPTVAGLWEQSNDKGEVGAWFVFAENNGVFEGRLGKLFKKPGEPVIEICLKCVGDRKNARMLGLTIVYGMTRDGLKYKDGSILDPRDGSLYHAEMEMSPDGQNLYVRGYVLVPLLGQTQVWKRLPDDAIQPDAMPKEVLAPPAKP